MMKFLQLLSPAPGLGASTAQRRDGNDLEFFYLQGRTSGVTLTLHSLTTCAKEVQLIVSYVLNLHGYEYKEKLSLTIEVTLWH